MNFGFQENCFRIQVFFEDWKLRCATVVPPPGFLASRPGLDKFLVPTLERARSGSFRPGFTTSIILLLQNEGSSWKKNFAVVHLVTGNHCLWRNFCNNSKQFICVKTLKLLFSFALASLASALRCWLIKYIVNITYYWLQVIVSSHSIVVFWDLGALCCCRCFMRH